VPRFAKRLADSCNAISPYLCAIASISGGGTSTQLTETVSRRVSAVMRSPFEYQAGTDRCCYGEKICGCQNWNVLERPSEWEQTRIQTQPQTHVRALARTRAQATQAQAQSRTHSHARSLLNWRRLCWRQIQSAWGGCYRLLHRYKEVAAVRPDVVVAPFADWRAVIYEVMSGRNDCLPSAVWSPIAPDQNPKLVPLRAATCRSENLIRCHSNFG
jgi:hypothetical protein